MTSRAVLGEMMEEVDNGRSVSVPDMVSLGVLFNVV